MPRLDGPTACMLIRELAPDVPILPFTGYPGDQAIAPLRELSCLPPLLKPVAPNVLAETIRNALGTTPPPLTPGVGVLSWRSSRPHVKSMLGGRRRYSRSSSVRPPGLPAPAFRT
jgi:DNA-binding NarL/FixJ family response regulator